MRWMYRTVRDSPVRRFIRQQLVSDRLLRSSFFLMASLATMAGLGFAFWLVVAQLYTPEEVGLGTSLISATSLIAYLSLFGLDVSLIRFLARAKDRDSKITQSIILCGALGLVIAALYLLVVPWYAPTLADVRDTPLFAAGFVVACALSGVNLLTDSVFIASRRPEFNLLVDGFLQGATRIILPVMFVSLGGYGVFAAVGCGYGVSVAASILCMYLRLGYRAKVAKTPSLTRDQFTYSLAGYVSSVLNIAPVMALPLIVLHDLGSASAGYFFVAFQVANTLYGVSYAVGQAFFAEGSFDESRITSVIKRSGVLIALLQVPGVGLVVGLADTVLACFGHDYAVHSMATLRILAFGAFAVALNTWSSALLKLLGLMRRLIESNVVYSVVTIGMAFTLGGRGLTDISWAWVLGNLASGVYAVAVVALDRRRTQARRAVHVRSAGSEPEHDNRSAPQR